MANESDFLGLVLPNKGEYVNTWQIPVNQNMVKLDTAIKDLTTEVTDARFNKTSLAEFLAVSHNNDGTLVATEEVKQSRHSTVYGDRDASDTPYELNERLEQGDRDVGDAREGAASLRAALARRLQPTPSMIIEGSKDGDNYPTWLGFTGANLQIDGSGTPLLTFIEGQLTRIRKLETHEVSGADGVYYLFAEFQEDGVVVVDGDSSTAPPATATGATSNDTDSTPRIFSDTAVPDWAGAGVEVGDILRILDGNDAGVYIIDEVGVDGDPAKLKIRGQFPQGGIASLNYTVSDPLGVVLSTDTDPTPQAGKHIIGEADFAGGAVTAVRPRHFKDSFVGAWQAVDVGATALFELSWPHRLGTDALSVSVQVSQANDGSAPVEEMSVAELDYYINVDNQLVFNANGSGATLTGDVVQDSGTIVYPTRTMRMKYDRNTVTLSNPVSGKFYTSYPSPHNSSPVERTTGYIRVIVQKRG